MKTQPRLPSEKEQKLVESVQVRPIRAEERIRCMRLLKRYHYLGELQPVGEQLIYVAVSRHGGWRAILVFCAAAKHLRHRDRWIGWTNEQRRRRLALVANNARFLILPGYAVPNLATRVLRLTLDRVSADWLERYGHPLAAVETFVDPERFQGTAYKAGGWVELGLTRGCRRVGRDYYVRHNKPKRLFVRELCRNARRGLQAEHLKPEWATVEQKVSPRCTHKAKEIRSLVEHLKRVPDFRTRIQSYPVWSLLAIVALAYLCGAPRGQKDLAKFARQMSRGQRRALGIRRNRQREFPAPTQPTFCRLLKAVDAREVEVAILAFQHQVRGPAPQGEMVAVDGKAAKRSGGEMLLNAVTVPSLYYLGSEPVPVDKTNEIPVARALFERLDLEGRLVGLDALHTQAETARALVQEAGADYMLTVKDNQKGLRRTVQNRFSAIPAVFPPQPITSAMAWTDEINKGRRERRQIHTQVAAPEPIGFPHVEQIAQLYRHIGKHKPETVWLLTSCEPDRLDAAQWLQANRDYWGVEGGFHQRLDASTNEDQCRVRDRNAIWVLGMFRRLAVSLFAEWRSRDTKRKRATMTDFQSEMGAEHASYAMRFITTRYSTFRKRS